MQQVNLSMFLCSGATFYDLDRLTSGALRIFRVYQIPNYRISLFAKMIHLYFEKYVE